jgi:pSer/pThr/pTyr-binding forkhead associated (FHA) protein
MDVCPHCGFENRHGVLVCGSCGKALFESHPNAIAQTRESERADEASFPRIPEGTARFGQGAALVIRIREGAELTIPLVGERIIIGRADVTSHLQPDVDLTPFGGGEKGVSRVHAAIDRAGESLTIVDFGSRNGTYLNGQRLIPHEPYLLHDGDEMRLGELTVQIGFLKGGS